MLLSYNNWIIQLELYNETKHNFANIPNYKPAFLSIQRLRHVAFKEN